jgi:chorismate mutase
MSDDDVLRELREQVSATDRAIVELVNTRLGLVRRIKQRKDELGVPFLDPERERRILEQLEESNSGPLSGDGLRELHGELLALTKREVEGR